MTIGVNRIINKIEIIETIKIINRKITQRMIHGIKILIIVGIFKLIKMNKVDLQSKIGQIIIQIFQKIKDIKITIIIEKLIVIRIIVEVEAEIIKISIRNSIEIKIIKRNN